MTKNILFITEKLNELNGSTGVTNTFHNIFETCDYSRLFTYDNIFIDEIFLANANLSVAILEQLSKKEYDYIIFSYYGCDQRINPSISFIEYLYNTYKSKLIFLWWDATHPCNQQQIIQLDTFATKQISFDGTLISGINSLGFSSVPQNIEYYYPDKHSTFISFIGRPDYPERQSYLRHLKQNNIDIQISGGRNQYNLSVEEYARKIRESKINVNFCNTPHGWAQCKGRIWEVLACKSMLLEQYNSITAQYLTDNKHCIFFNDKEDMVLKINSLYKNDDMINEISNNGYDLYIEKYSSIIFWNHMYEL